MDKFKEFIVKKELTANEKISRVFIGLCAVSLAAAVFLITFTTALQLMGFFAAVLCIYGGWKLLSGFFIEYEYILTNFDLDIDKISNQAKRKRLCTIDLHTVTEIGKVDGDFSVSENETLVKIAKKHNKSVAQVVLRWNVQRGVSILPKSTHVERMAQNIDIWDFELTEDEMKTIGEKDLGHSEIINHFDPQLVKMLCGMKIHE